MNQLLRNQECVARARVKKEEFWISTCVLDGEDTLKKNEIEIKFHVPDCFDEIRTKVDRMCARYPFWKRWIVSLASLIFVAIWVAIIILKIYLTSA